MSKKIIKKSPASQTFVTSSVPVIQEPIRDKKENYLSYNNNGINSFLGWK